MSERKEWLFVAAFEMMGPTTSEEEAFGRIIESIKKNNRRDLRVALTNEQAIALDTLLKTVLPR